MCSIKFLAKIKFSMKAKKHIYVNLLWPSINSKVTCAPKNHFLKIFFIIYCQYMFDLYAYFHSYTPNATWKLFGPKEVHK